MGVNLIITGILNKNAKHLWCCELSPLDEATFVMSLCWGANRDNNSHWMWKFQCINVTRLLRWGLRRWNPNLEFFLQSEIGLHVVISSKTYVLVLYKQKMKPKFMKSILKIKIEWDLVLWIGCLSNQKNWGSAQLQ